MLPSFKLHQRYYARVIALAGGILHSGAEAEDVAQEVFIELWRKLEQFDPAKGSEWSWVKTISRSRCLDRLRSNQRIAGLARSQPAVSEHGERADEGLDGGKLRTCLAQLPQAQREALELAYFEGLSHREVADRLRSPLGTVKTRLRMGLQRLSAMLAPEATAFKGRNAAGG